MSSAASPQIHTATDVVIIGSGPGGEGAAMNLAKRGKQVVVVDYTY